MLKSNRVSTVSSNHAWGTRSRRSVKSNVLLFASTWISSGTTPPPINQAFMRMDENLTRFNSLFAGDGPNRLFVYFQAADRADEVSK